MQDWFLIQFKPNAHRMAERNLNQQGFSTFLPLEEVTIRAYPKFINVLRPVFPGYMFVNVETNVYPWRKIKNTFGVSRIVSVEGIPKPVPSQLVSCLMSRCDKLGKLLPTVT